ncbi:MAG: phosphoenolpyruvate--protein phosphotransferase [Candidatus Mcinerneyibacterium aminivorans]|uniref:Phosphoenolpyruvate-protein phosphotransferase n=1 Tax=Candidatus Mcinerneyibacterium aminivorans TaxID=2703815 RepID=A0A5D0M9I4_9BACT|nr:MAG: phosphoenolpyruvate--protein phosphotransferase [Candidatus Mcinerneyibacterium aminivorans]
MRGKGVILKIYDGVSASSGIAIGHALPIHGFGLNVPRIKVDDDELENEILLFKKAVEETKEELENVKTKIKNDIGVEESAIFDAHIMLLDDPNLIEKTIERARNENVSIDYSFSETISNLVEKFRDLSDDYLKDRANDIQDVGKRVLRNYLGVSISPELSKTSKDIIVLAHNLLPSDMAEISEKEIKGIITEVGGETSHVAIMARSMEVPAVVGVSDILSNVSPNDLVIIDANNGKIFIEPDKETIKEYQEKRRKYVEYVKSLERIRNEEAVTRDGKKIKLDINMELANEADMVNSHKADGIGLFRTEYLFMREILPSEDEQFEIYKYIAQMIYPKEVVIRTADLGGDKFVSHFKIPEEMNPFLGFRGIRLSLEFEEFFKTQLKAILRASTLKNIKIMFPMISGIDEFLEAKDIVEEAKNELRDSGVEFDENIDIGIMVEIPSAALVSDVLAKHADFFSIGTNDLIQYTLAVDRGNKQLSYLYDPLHPSILRLLKMIINNAHNEGIEVSMCGNMAGNPNFTILLIGLNLSILSVAPSNILEIKKIIRELSYEECKKIVDESMKYNDVKSIKDYYDSVNSEKLKNVLFDYFEKE